MNLQQPPEQVIQHEQRMNDYLDDALAKLRKEIQEATRENKEVIEVIMKMINDNKESIKRFQERRSRAGD